MRRRSKPCTSSRAVPRAVPHGCDKGDDASILRHAALLKEPYIVAMDKFNPLIKGREVAAREFENLRVGFEGDAL